MTAPSVHDYGGERPSACSSIQAPTTYANEACLRHDALEWRAACPLREKSARVKPEAGATAHAYMHTHTHTGRVDPSLQKRNGRSANMPEPRANACAEDEAGDASENPWQDNRSKLGVKVAWKRMHR